MCHKIQQKKVWQEKKINATLKLLFLKKKKILLTFGWNHDDEQTLLWEVFFRWIRIPMTAAANLIQPGFALDLPQSFEWKRKSNDWEVGAATIARMTGRRLTRLYSLRKTPQVPVGTYEVFCSWWNPVNSTWLSPVKDHLFLELALPLQALGPCASLLCLWNDATTGTEA